MITTADALDLMTLITACHRRTAPRMDDREVAIATATIWAELFNRHALQMPDLIAAIKHRAETEPDAPEPAEIIRHAKEIRAQRTQAETAKERRAREDRQDAALAARQALTTHTPDRHGTAPPTPKPIGTDHFHTRLAEATSRFGQDIPEA